MEKLKNFLKKFEDIMTAVTFAEAGDAETVRKLPAENKYGHKKPAEIKKDGSKPIILKPSRA